MLAGYDWILKNVVHGFAAHNGWQNTADVPNLSVCGELMGGSLASMLALTECHTLKPGIGAAVVGNPVTDWTFSGPGIQLGEENSSIEPRKRKSQSKKESKLDSWTEFSNHTDGVSAQALLSARDMLFSKPENWFDPFASPLLFFRTSTSDVSFDEPLIESIDSSTHYDPNEPSSAPDASQPPIRRRKAHRRYPPVGSDLKLPAMRIEVGEKNVLRDQGVEFAQLMRRSIGMYERPRSFEEDVWGVREVEDVEVREDRVQVLLREGSGCWDLDDWVGIGEWLRKNLGAR